MVNSIRSSSRSSSRCVYCNDVKPVPQFGGTCWLNALLTCLFYSMGMRYVLSRESSLYWHRALPFRLAEIFKAILADYSERKPHFGKHIKPEHVIVHLNEWRPDLMRGVLEPDFEHPNVGSPRTVRGASANTITGPLLDALLHKHRFVMMDAYRFSGTTYGIWNDERSWSHMDPLFWVYNNGSEPWSARAPGVIVVACYSDALRVQQQHQWSAEPRVKFEANQLTNKFFGRDYVTDAVCLVSFDDDIGQPHAIAGVTCNGMHFMYNGWQFPYHAPAARRLRAPMLDENAELFNPDYEKRPCKLTPHNWVFGPHKDFSIDSLNCSFPELKPGTPATSDLCFNVEKGEQTMYFLVRADLYTKALGPCAAAGRRATWVCPHGVHMDPTSGECLAPGKRPRRPEFSRSVKR